MLLARHATTVRADAACGELLWSALVNSIAARESSSAANEAIKVGCTLEVPSDFGKYVEAVASKASWTRDLDAAAQRLLAPGVLRFTPVSPAPSSAAPSSATVPTGPPPPSFLDAASYGLVVTAFTALRATGACNRAPQPPGTSTPASHPAIEQQITASQQLRGLLEEPTRAAFARCLSLQTAGIDLTASFGPSASSVLVDLVYRPVAATSSPPSPPPRSDPATAASLQPPTQPSSLNQTSPPLSTTTPAGELAPTPGPMGTIPADLTGVEVAPVGAAACVLYGLPPAKEGGKRSPKPPPRRKPPSRNLQSTTVSPLPPASAEAPRPALRGLSAALAPGRVYSLSCAVTMGAFTSSGLPVYVTIFTSIAPSLSILLYPSQPTPAPHPPAAVQTPPPPSQLQPPSPPVDQDAWAQLQARLQKLERAVDLLNARAEDMRLEDLVKAGFQDQQAFNERVLGPAAVLLRSDPLASPGPGFGAPFPLGTGAGAWVQGGSIDPPRTDHAVIAHGKWVYMIGGMTAQPVRENSSAPYTEPVVLSSVVRYDTDTGVVEQLAPLPEPRCRFATAVLNGRIYVMGGAATFAFPEPRDSVFVYDISTNSWKAAGRLNVARLDPCGAAAGGKVYVFGGYDVNYITLTSTEQLTLPAGLPPAGAANGTAASPSPAPASAAPASAWLWTLLPSSSNLNTSRGDCRAVELDGLIYAAGGIQYVNADCSQNWVYCYRPLSSVEAFDPVTLRWTPRASMARERLDFGFTALPGGRLLAAGGERGNGTRFQIAQYEVEEYDARTDTWTPRAPMTQARFRHDMAHSSGRVYVVGGTPTCQDYEAEVVCYQQALAPVAVYVDERYPAMFAFANATGAA
ncbi:hypothetical protein HYH03_014055 [Edaphochlamys debaryana]|uniref:Uncharacterized protein n=1 Tax=Edaphochlamys debaryana TaxID=47281 RepID=A0A835XX40_9CHLO|nr:hypothetical protein HYH03_014055 [Edaphochlamys debaryana]|eukprot:KAG2487339.1 hypothetical protein HYH03_014055 [Edaphochlamys debaryana]